MSSSILEEQLLKSAPKREKRKRKNIVVLSQMNILLYKVHP